MDDATPAPKPQADKPLYLMQGSPLVAGGKARLMSNKKVKPSRAKPREVTGPEEKGYTTEPHKALKGELEAPSAAWVDAESDLAAERNRLRLLKQAELAQRARKHIKTEDRILDAQRRAKMRHVDMTREFFLIRKMLSRGNDAPAVQRLERAEALLDGVLDQAA